MTGSEFQKSAICTVNIDDPKDMLRHAVFGLTSEAGEVSGILQKEYQGHPFDPEHMKKELGDCLWMMLWSRTLKNGVLAIQMVFRRRSR